MSFLILQATASGIVTGCVYALVALSLVIVYKSTDVVNFAGGELLMLGGYLGLLALAATPALMAAPGSVGINRKGGRSCSGPGLLPCSSGCS